jgi:hypothetical protein
MEAFGGGVTDSAGQGLPSILDKINRQFLDKAGRLKQESIFSYFRNRTCLPNII